VLVGLNKFVGNEGDNILPGGLSEIPQEEIEKEAVRRVKDLRKSRNNSLVKDALYHLKETAEKKGNIIPATIDAVKSSATLEEIMNTTRAALGYSRNPFNVRSDIPPFK